MSLNKDAIAAPFIQVEEDENGVLKHIEFVNDENLRRCGYDVIRDRNTGIAMIYKDNILVRKENIKGEIIC